MRRSFFFAQVIPRPTIAHGCSQLQAVHGTRHIYVRENRANHFWTLVHPAIEMEDDVKQFMDGHPELAALLLLEPDPWLP